MLLGGRGVGSFSIYKWTFSWWDGLMTVYWTRGIDLLFGRLDDDLQRLPSFYSAFGVSCCIATRRQYGQKFGKALLAGLDP
jgi:hypothetical protein